MSSVNLQQHSIGPAAIAAWVLSMLGFQGVAAAPAWEIPGLWL